jgi:hypothetical protein
MMSKHAAGQQCSQVELIDNFLSNRMKTEEILYFLGIWAIVLLAMALVVQHTQYKSLFLVRPALEMKEPFQNAQPQAVVGITEDSSEGQNIQPADADLQNLKQPYHLLRGVLPDSPTDKTSGLSAQRCFETDFTRRIEKTGNYRQLTNNYKRETPDSCTSPMTELVNSFYKVNPLPAS